MHIKGMDHHKIVNYIYITFASIYFTDQDGDKFWKLPECFIKGTSIKYLRIPEEIIDMVAEEEQHQRKLHFSANNRGRGREGGRGRGEGGRGRGEGGRGRGREGGRGRGEGGRGRGRDGGRGGREGGREGGRGHGRGREGRGN